MALSTGPWGGGLYVERGLWCARCTRGPQPRATQPTGKPGNLLSAHSGCCRRSPTTTHPWPSQALRPSTDCTGSVLSCQPQDSHYWLTWRRSAYCFCTSGIEEVTFRSASRSFFRLALASEWMISKLILKGAKRQDGWDPRASAGKRSQRALDRTVPDTTQASSHTPLRALGPTNFPHCRFQESVSPEGALYA